MLKIINAMGKRKLETKSTICASSLVNIRIILERDILWNLFGIVEITSRKLQVAVVRVEWAPVGIEPAVWPVERQPIWTLPSQHAGN